MADPRNPATLKAWHVAPRGARASIEEHGIDPSRTRRGLSFFLTVKPTQEEVRGFDLWEVELKEGEFEDAASLFGPSVTVTRPVKARRVRPRRGKPFGSPGGPRDPRGFLRNPPVQVVKEREFFTWGPHRFDVAKGWKIIADRGALSEKPDTEIDASEWIGMLGGLIRIDRRRALKDKTVDITQPVLVATMTLDDDPEPFFMVIDGWHRMFKADHQEEPNIPAFVLDEDETESIKVPYGRFS